MKLGVFRLAYCLSVFEHGLESCLANADEIIVLQLDIQFIVIQNRIRT